MEEKMDWTTKLWSSMALAALLVGSAPIAQAEDYPNRIVTIVAPSAPGGLYSLFARFLANRFEQRLGQTFVVENRPGASSIVGSMAVIRSPHDGYTLMIANSTGLAVNPAIRKNLPYDPVKDFAPIALLGRVPEVLVVNAALPVHSVADLAKLAKQTPGGLSYSSAGVGTGQHLGGVLLSHLLGVPLTHVPYKGMQPAINDVAGGHIQFMISPVPFALPLAQAGKIRMLGVTTTERFSAIPDVPPLAEVGLTGFTAMNWWMLVAPSGTPQAVVDKLNGTVKAMASDPEAQQELIRIGIVPAPTPPPSELTPFIVAEQARLGEIVKKAGLAGSL
jgi:tripartite-type tricarboxylate transporter receptor subunit TctC